MIIVTQRPRKWLIGWQILIRLFHPTALLPFKTGRFHRLKRGRILFFRLTGDLHVVQECAANSQLAFIFSSRNFTIFLSHVVSMASPLALSGCVSSMNGL
jgi:hypothetical protein